MTRQRKPLPTPPLYAVIAQILLHNYFLSSITGAHNELLPVDMTCYLKDEFKQTGSQEIS